jgi:hypothetical protein
MKFFNPAGREGGYKAGGLIHNELTIFILGKVTATKTNT